MASALYQAQESRPAGNRFRSSIFTFATDSGNTTLRLEDNMLPKNFRRPFGQKSQFSCGLLARNASEMRCRMCLRIAGLLLGIDGTGLGLVSRSLSSRQETLVRVTGFSVIWHRKFFGWSRRLIRCPG